MEHAQSVRSVGFIGLGAMGLPMAKRICSHLAGGAQLFAFDIISENVDKLVDNNQDIVVRCNSAREVAENSDVTFTMLPEGRHVKSVYIESTSSISSANVGGKTFIDCSTIDPETSTSIRNYFSQHCPTAMFYDAPVSGGTNGAAEGKLSFFVGCTEKETAVTRCMPLLQSMGTQILFLRGPSLGLVAKLANNYLAGVIGLACIEAYDIGIRSGLDPRLLERVFANGSGQNAISERFNPVPGVIPSAPSSQGFKPGFRVELMRKDIDLALGLAKTIGCNNILGDATLKTYDAAIANPEFRGKDSKILYRYLKCIENWQEKIA